MPAKIYWIYIVQHESSSKPRKIDINIKPCLSYSIYLIDLVRIYYRSFSEAQSSTTLTIPCEID